MPPTDPAWTDSCDLAIAAIRERLEPGDVIGIIAGRCQARLAAAFPGYTSWDWGVGYSGVLPGTFRIFESRAWAAHVAGRTNDDTIRAFDAVIPNSWEPDEIHEGAGDGGYLLYIGRVMARKGPHVAAEAAKAIGARLVVAGQGVATAEPGRIVATDGTVLTGDVEYAGVVGPEERDRLFGGAVATFVPTQYLEPFGGVAVESMLAGTPAIASDWGAFPETVAHLRSGFLCRTLADFVAAALTAPDLDRVDVRAWAVERFTTDVVRWRYDQALRRLDSLWGAGWYALAPRDEHPGTPK